MQTWQAQGTVVARSITPYESHPNGYNIRIPEGREDRWRLAN